MVPAAAAQGAAQTVSSKDEEDGGKAPVPDGEPTDPQNAQSKRWSYRAMLILGFALAIGALSIIAAALAAVN